MPDLTPEKLAELRRLLDAAWASQPQRTPPGRAQQADPWATTPARDEPPF